ncbi:hypothetical protein [Phenylobacterium sp.]|uniref:hypothetical protein n=1 Tax=Phenylobacterium sp. TaxID=1871053 RepID=UPI0028113AD6|nr:hypothetical protein [Phenylobacterium sp.]
MATYRAFRLDDNGEIKTGVWVTAQSDAQALAQAAELCEDGAPVVEVWRGERLVDEIECEDGEA